MARMNAKTQMVRCNDAAINYDELVAVGDRTALYEIKCGGSGWGIGEHDEIVGFMRDGFFPDIADVTFHCVARSL